MFPSVSSLTGICIIARSQAHVISLYQQNVFGIFNCSLPNESAKGAESTRRLAGALLPKQTISMRHLLGEGSWWFWTCWQTTPFKAKLLDVFYKTYGCIPLVILYLLRLSMLILISLLSLSHHITIIMQKHLTTSTKWSLKRGVKEELLCFICLNIPWFQHIYQSLSNLCLGRVYQFHKAHTLARYNDIILAFSASHRRAQKD